MKQKVTVVARTVEAPIEGKTKDGVSFLPADIRDESMILSGKAAGICYMPDDYLSNGIQMESIAMKRAKRNTESGHYSVFEHSHISFIVETTKAMAMVLNSTKLYSTSEKSGRYTSMNPETEIEAKYYAKWNELIQKEIEKKFGDKYTKGEREKLALENARYFLSVFTPTVMMYTLTFSRVILLAEWLDKLANTIRDMINEGHLTEYSKWTYNFYSELEVEARVLAEEFRKSLDLSKEEPILVDHKDIGITFFDTISNFERRYFVKGALHIDEDNFNFVRVNKNPMQLSNDMYCSTYITSFACLAQLQRHRTIDYKIKNIHEGIFYTPTIVFLNDELRKQWQEDMNDLYENSNVVPQAASMTVQESGHFDNFYLKAKERVCTRAQKEIMDITVCQIAEMNAATKLDADFEKLSPLNAAKLLSMIEHRGEHGELVVPRCMWRSYKCKEPCKHMTLEIARDRIL